MDFFSKMETYNKIDTYSKMDIFDKIHTYNKTEIFDKIHTYNKADKIENCNSIFNYQKTFKSCDGTDLFNQQNQLASPSSAKSVEKRKTQTCSLCKNHQIHKIKKGHKCDFEKKEHIAKCKECEMTMNRRKHSANDKKNNWNLQKISPLPKLPQTNPNKKRKDQLCRKCCNHKEFVSMKEHKGKCKYDNCPCEACLHTDERRESVKKEAKAKRQKNKVNSSNPSFSSCSSSPKSDSFSYQDSPSSKMCMDYNNFGSFNKYKSILLDHNYPSFYEARPIRAVDLLPDLLQNQCNLAEKQVFLTNESNSKTFEMTVVPNIPVKSEFNDTLIDFASQMNNNYEFAYLETNYEIMNELQPDRYFDSYCENLLKSTDLTEICHIMIDDFNAGIFNPVSLLS